MAKDWVKELAKINQMSGVGPNDPVPTSNVIKAFGAANLSTAEQAKILAGFMTTTAPLATADSSPDAKPDHKPVAGAEEPAAKPDAKPEEKPTPTAASGGAAEPPATDSAPATAKMSFKKFAAMVTNPARRDEFVKIWNTLPDEEKERLRARYKKTISGTAPTSEPAAAPEPATPEPATPEVKPAQRQYQTGDIASLASGRYQRVQLPGGKLVGWKNLDSGKVLSLPAAKAIGLNES